MKKIILSIIFAFAFTIVQGCNTFADIKIQDHREGETLKGYYIYGHETNTFQPCGQKRIFWVLGSNEILGALEQQYNNITTKPYEEVFVEITGNFSEKASDGFAMDYDGQIWVNQIFAVKKKTKTNCN